MVCTLKLDCYIDPDKSVKKEKEQKNESSVVMSASRSKCKIILNSSKIKSTFYSIHLWQLTHGQKAGVLPVI